MPLERNGAQDSELSILSNNFGGLNTTASPLNLPYEDSPALLNVDVDISGNIYKRQGTEVLAQYPDATAAYSHPVTTVLGYNFVVVKYATTLSVYEFVGNALGTVADLTNVFSAAAQSAKPYYLLLPDLEPRLLVLTGSNAPVHLQFVEQSTTQTVASTTSLTIPNAQRYQNITGTTKVFINRQMVSASVSYSAGNINITLSAPVSGTITVDLIGVTWQWWAESLRWTGDRFYDTYTRFHITKSDQSIELARVLISDIAYTGGVYGSYPIRLYSSAVNTDFLGASTQQPATNVQYGFGDGANYTVGTNNYLNLSPFYVTFGDIKTGCTPSPCVQETIHALRLRELRFNDDTDIAGTNLKLYIDGVETSRNLSGTAAGTRQYHAYTAGGVLSTLVSDRVRYAAFTASTPMGIAAASVVVMTNTERAFIGSSANTGIDPYTPGSMFRVHGLGLFANYLTGSFPTVAALYQGRLALSGMRHDPTRVVFSAVNDTVEPGIRYNYFQVTSDLSGLDTDPFDMVVSSSSADDYVNGLVEWQNSLFILTRRGVFRASGGNNTIAPTRRFLNFVSALGLVNQWSVVRTDVAVYYLSDFGVFNLIPRVEDGEYVADERSLKIRKLFEGLGDTARLAWMAFDSVRKKMYVALPRVGDPSYSSTLLVYNTFRDSWTQYASVDGFKSFTGHQYVDRFLKDGFMLMAVTPPSKTGFLRLNASRYVDYYTSFSYPSAGTALVSVTQFPVTFTTQDTNYYFTSAVPSLPVSDVQDTVAYIGSQRLQQGVDYVKTPQGIYLVNQPSAGSQLRLYPRRAVTDTQVGMTNQDVTQAVDVDPLVVWLNNIELKQGSDYVLTKSGTTYQTLLSIPVTSGSVVGSGYTYLAYYTTPMFVLQQLGTIKRTKHIYLFLDNEIGQELYQAGDAIGGTPLDSIVGAPKVDMTANVIVAYDNQRTGEVSYDLYGYRDLVWDFSSFDVVPSSLQSDRYILLKEAVKGSGYAYQATVWSNDAGAWKLAGYQFDVREKGKRHVTRTA